MIGRLAWAACLVALGAAACRKSSAAPGGPRLTARWTGADTAEFSGRAEAEWCDSLHVLEIRAVAGDTGVGIALYPGDTVEAGTFPVRRPDVADTTGRPAAAIGLRWLSQTSLPGFQGDSGELTLARGRDGALSGRFTAAAHAVAGAGQLHVTGSFAGVRPTRAAPECAGRPPVGAASPDGSRPDEPAADIKD